MVTGAIIQDFYGDWQHGFYAGMQDGGDPLLAKLHAMSPIA